MPASRYSIPIVQAIHLTHFHLFKLQTTVILPDNKIANYTKLKAYTFQFITAGKIPKTYKHNSEYRLRSVPV